MKNILILGGTNFIGRHLVEKLMGYTHYRLTLFNRGKTNPDLIPQINRIIGDRGNPEDLEPLFLQNWDVVIDLSCYYTNWLRQIVEKINPSIENYVLVSSCSVYDMTHKASLRDETAPTLQCTLDQEIDRTASSYGNRKSKCEEVLKSSGLPFTILRPALVYGPYDNTDRFYHWIYQAAKREKIIVPEAGNRFFSITYVKDLVGMILESIITTKYNGVFNCVSHPSTSIADILERILKETQTSPTWINMSAQFLLEKDIKQWEGIPLWLNSDEFTFSNQLIKSEFNFIPTELSDSIKSTIAYYAEFDFPEPNYGISLTKQNDLILQCTHHE